MKPLSIAVVGAGTIGRRHVAAIDRSPDCTLRAIVDPSDDALAFAQSNSCRHYRTLDELLVGDRPDGVVLATPNQFHVPQGIACAEAGIPALIEKPVAETVELGRLLIASARASDVPFMVGHHRLHSPIMERALEVVSSGALGQLVAITASALYYKPDTYFSDAPWRTKRGAGPILLNLIHDIGNLRALAGEIIAVQAITSNAVRGYEVEDTAAVVLRFESGALGTLILSDAAASPRSWEHTSGEVEIFPRSQDEDCYVVTGTRGSLAIPTMRLKQFGDEVTPSWTEPFEVAHERYSAADPFDRQISHFCALIRGEQSPRVTLEDGLRNVEICNAIIEAARLERSVDTKPS